MADQRLVVVTPDLLVGNYAAPSNGGHLGDQDISDDRTPSEPDSTVALEPKGTAPAHTHREATIFTDSSEYPFYETHYGPLSPRYWFTEFNGERTRTADTQSPLLRRKPSSTSGGLLQRCSLYWKQMLRDCPWLFAVLICAKILILCALVKVLTDVFSNFLASSSKG